MLFGEVAAEDPGLESLLVAEGCGSTFKGTCLSLALFILLKVDQSGGCGSSKVVKDGIMVSPVSSNLIGTIRSSALALVGLFPLLP